MELLEMFCGIHVPPRYPYSDNDGVARNLNQLLDHVHTILRRISCCTHRDDHGIAQDLDQLLVHEAHVAGAEEAEVASALLLDGEQLLHGHKEGGQTTCGD